MLHYNPNGSALKSKSALKPCPRKENSRLRRPTNISPPYVITAVIRTQTNCYQRSCRQCDLTMLEVDRMSTARLSLAGEVWHLSGVARGGSPSTAPRTVAKRVVDASCQPYMEPQSNRLESCRSLSTM